MSLAAAVGICTGVCTASVSVFVCEQRDRAGWERCRWRVMLQPCQHLGVPTPCLLWRSPGTFAVKAVEKSAEAARSIIGNV